MGKIIDISEVLLHLGLGDSATDTERAVAMLAMTSAEGAVKKHLGYDPVLQERTEYYPRMDLNGGFNDSVWEANETSAYLRQVSQASTDELQVQHLPVRSTPAIDLRIDYDGRFGTRTGSFGTETVKVEGDDYWPNYDGLDSGSNKICKDGIIKSIGLWPTTAGSVKIVYTSGYSDSELRGQDSVIDASPIWEACINEAVARARNSFLQMKTSGRGWTSGPLSSETLGSYSYSVGSPIGGSSGSFSLRPDSIALLESFVNYGIMIGG